jgi:hypothetical protein
MGRILFMSSRTLRGAQNDWATVASLLDLPAEYDYALIFLVFSETFLQPVFQQATDLYEMMLRWNRSRTRFKPGAIRRLTHSGDDGWVIPEFAWDPAGRRLLWTQNHFSAGRRVDEGCIVRQIRAGLIDRLSRVQTLGQIPLDIVPKIRAQAADLLRDPTTYPFQGSGCGGSDPNQQPAIDQETEIGRFE